VNITPDGMEFLKDELNIISNYYNKLMDSISEEEKILLLKLIGNFLDVMTQELPSKVNYDKQKMKARKITIE
jgi:Mor family transcriptional regulator